MADAHAAAKVSFQNYTYTPIDQLQHGKVYNVYGVVIFFKPPYRSKGTDYCLVVTIVDQSEAKLKCMLFSGNQETLPKIYKVGDIVRFHRVKVQQFNGELQGINSSGFSSLVFDGIVGSSVSPRSTSKCYSFHPHNDKVVEVLRQWAANHLKVFAQQIKISDVQSIQYFDLLCQLVGKAEVDNSSYLIKVWDGTKNSASSWNVFVEEDALEGDQKRIHQLQSLTIDVLVYDNHVESAKSLKIGSYLLIHNVHAKLHTPGKENEAKNPYLEFHLHGGTCFGRGITVLPENNSDVQDLQRLLVSVHQSLDNIASQEICSSLHPPLAYAHPTLLKALKAQQDWPITPLAAVIKSKAPRKYRIKARLRTYEPQNLYQSVKLYCVKCNSLHNVPDEDSLENVLQNSSDYEAMASMQSTSWYQSAVWNTHNQQNRHVAIHFVKRHDILQNPEDTLIMLQGGTLHEIYKLSRRFDSIIPVKAIQGNLEIDISVPFLIQGNRWHYGCNRCSKIKSTEMLQSLSQEISWNATEIAKVLGIQPLRYVFIMKFTFEDETGKLNAFLWNYSEQFFHTSANEILLDNKLQEKLCNIMDTLSPPRKTIGEYPWLECCIKSYNTTNGERKQICYEIFDTEVVEDDL
uniref:Protection of telomeres protein 1 n=1 Tax=Xenopus tropicalis TaxID=8364 RepID=A0A6I8QSC3_XENTR